MRVEIITDEELEEEELLLTCKHEDDEIRRVKTFAEQIGLVFTAKDETQTVRIHPEEIFYIESIDKRTFLYLQGTYYESSLRLYELEKRLAGLTFFRASKSCIVNVRHVGQINIMMNRNLMLTMENGERVIVSRRNVKEFNQFIGME